MKALLTEFVVEPLAELVRLDTLADLVGSAGLFVLVLSLGAALKSLAGA
ncbi:hypothetical protein [Rhodoplanes roseus]|nr:hypothetical protein [Rhodoplanes roseus]